MVPSNRPFESFSNVARDYRRNGAFVVQAAQIQTKRGTLGEETEAGVCGDTLIFDPLQATPIRSSMQG